MVLNATEFIEIPLKFEEQDTAFHHVFVKENISKASNRQKPAGRTLFVLNVPPYATAESLQNAFSSAGSVTKVIVQEKPSEEYDPKVAEEFVGKFKVAYVIYEQPSGLRKLLKTRKLNALNGDGSLLTGIDKWTKAYQERLPDPVAMQREIDAYMASYDREAEREKNQQEEGEPDDEGWVTVSKSTANTFAQREATISKLEDKIGKDRKDKELKNFYTFQIRESKKNDIVSLRKKYDRDLQKMEQIKKTKRFKPY